MIDNNWLTEEYLNGLGYYKIKDDGQYGVYKTDDRKVISITYGLLPKDYRTIKFNRDSSVGVCFQASADWDTRFSLSNVIAQSKEIFEILLNASI